VPVGCLTSLALVAVLIFLLKTPRHQPIDYPVDGTVFPPDIAAPAFRWAVADADVVAWQMEVSFDDGGPVLQATAGAPPWTPTESQWQAIKSRSVAGAATVTVAGIRRDGSKARRGSVSIRTAKEPVGAPLFYREVPLPFSEAVKDPSRIRWRFGSVSSPTQPPVVLENLPVCGNCHSFSADGRQFGMDVDYANNKGSYVLSSVEPQTVLDPSKIITWSDYRRDDKEPTFGLLSQISPDGRYVVSTVKDRSVFVPKPDLEFSQLFFPIKGILVVYDRRTKQFFPLPGADDPHYVQSNPAWSPDGRHIVFARARAYQLQKVADSSAALLTAEECAEFIEGGKTFQFDLYRIAFNGGKGGQAVPLAGASGNGMSNYFPKYSPDGRWIVFCKAASFMLLQPDSELCIIPAEGGSARRLECNSRRMNSWHTWSPNGRWLAFTSKANGPYSQIFLTHIDEDGHSSPPVELSNFTAADRAANIPEFVNAPPAALKKIVEQFVDDLSHWRAGGEYLKAKDWQGAERMYRKALEINPNYAEAHNSLGLVLDAQGRVDEAIAHFQKALKIKPNDELAHYNLGNMLAGRGQVDEAIAHYQQALIIKPDYEAAHFNLGNVLAGRGQVDEAIVHYRKALEIKPDDAEAHSNLGIVLAGRGRLDEAIAHFQKALEIKPGDVKVRRNLEIARSKRGKF
jgi:Flp pilus assembly protein TadD